VTVQYGDRSWNLSTDEIQVALTVPSATSRDSPAPYVEPSLVSQFIDRIASDVERPAQDAKLVLAGDKVVLEPAVTARVLDRNETARRVWVAIRSEQRKAQPAVDERQPAVRDDDLTASLGLANTLIQEPVLVTGPDNRQWTLTTSALRDMLVLPTSGGNGQAPRVDATKLADFVAGLAQDVDMAPLNARFQRNSAGQVTAIRDSVDGLAVDRAEAARLIGSAAASSNRRVSLPVRSTGPAVTAADVGQLAGLQLIADNTTSYAGSIPPRRHNVEFATSLLNGVVVAPGDIFSFNHEMGPTTLDRGFQVGYGIEAQGDTVKTVPSVAGGICQVATTLFQPVFWTGYTIEERYPHAYWIAHYTSHGMVGLDTTVDEEAGLDFRFKNDTSSDILIQSSTDGTNVHFAVYGVAPAWKVQVDPPVITNLIKTDPKVVVENDSTMPKGQQIYTEAAQDGFTVTIRRTVTDSAGSSRQLNLRSNYAPAHNVIAVGTKV
jgi:vancomycin resistance protein YoaR